MDDDNDVDDNDVDDNDVRKPPTWHVSGAYGGPWDADFYRTRDRAWVLANLPEYWDLFAGVCATACDPAPARKRRRP